MVIAIQLLLIKIDAGKCGNLLESNAQRKLMAIISFAIGIGTSEQSAFIYERVT